MTKKTIAEILGGPKKKNLELVLEFGKHKGSKLSEIDKGYLAWLLLQPWLGEKLREAVNDVYKNGN